MKVGNINQIMFRSAVPIANPSVAENKRPEIKELGYVTPDFRVQTPQKYTNTGVKELPNGLKIHTYKLANGHKVSIIPMEGSPAIVKNYVNVGSLNETDDIKGISHFLEHMAFNGTTGSNGYEKLEQNDSFKKIEKLGGWTNASTNYAITDYVNSTPLLNESDIETQIKVIASMTEDLALTDEMIEKEKGPVCSEINMIMDRPETILLDQTVRTLFNIKSSADELVGGSVEHIKNLNRQKVKHYYDTYYTPDNMNLVITGDVDPQKVIEMVAKNFKSNKTRQGKIYEEKLTPINTTVRKDFITDKATSASVLLGFTGPKVNDTKENIIMKVALAYLDSNEAGIKKELKKINSYPESGVDKISTNPNAPQFLYFGTTCADDNSEQALKTIFEKISNIDRPSDEVIENIKERFKQNSQFALEKSSNVNQLVGRAILDGDLDYVTKHDEILNSVTADDVKDFINKHFDLSKAAVTLVHPDTNVETINKNYNETNNNNINFRGHQRKPVNMAKVNEITLSNNYKLLTHETINDNININIDLQFDSINKNINPAAYEILGIIYDLGTSELNEEEFEKFQEENNILLSGYVEKQAFSLTGVSNTKNLKKTVNKLNEMITSPRINQEEFDIAVTRLKDVLARSKDSAYSLYIKHESQTNPLYTSKEDILKGLETLTLKDVQELHEYILKNSNGTIAVNIPESKPEIREQIVSELERLPKINSFEYKVTDVYNENLKPVVITKDRAVSQADIMQTYKYKRENTAKEAATEKVLNTILSSSQSIGLFNTLREKEHLAYSVYSDIDTTGNTGELSCNILTTTDNKEIGEISYDNVKKSINGFHRQINKLLTSEYTDEDLENAKRQLKAKLLNKEGVSSKLYSLIDGAYSNYGTDYHNRIFEEIDNITRTDIQNLANKIFKNPPIYTVVASKDTLDANKEYFNSLEQV